jgi:hypothetical protein
MAIKKLSALKKGDFFNTITKGQINRPIWIKEAKKGAKVECSRYEEASANKFFSKDQLVNLI